MWVTRWRIKKTSMAAMTVVTILSKRSATTTSTKLLLNWNAEGRCYSQACCQNNMSNMVKVLGEDHNKVNMTIHGIRVSAGTAGANSGLGVAELADAIHQKSTSVAQRYIVSGKSDAVRRAAALSLDGRISPATALSTPVVSPLAGLSTAVQRSAQASSSTPSAWTPSAW